jgi:phage shock protein PspC (stress-responsive transcriptional regulator)
MVRLHEGRIITGVCAGLGRYTHVDPVVFRVGFAVLTLAGHGTGIFLYIAAFLLMPSAETENSVAEQVLRRRFDGDAVLVILGGLLTLGVVSSLLGGGLGGGLASGPVSVLTVFALALLVAHARGVNLLQVTRSLPERFQGSPYRPAEPPTPAPPPPPEGMIDLATLSSPSATGLSGTTRPLPTTPLPPPPAPPPGPPPAEMWPEPTMSTSAPADRPSSCGGSPLTTLTLLAACGAGGLAVPFTVHQPVATRVSVPVAVALAVLGVGLIIASWYGRSRGLASLGVVLCLALVTTSAVGALPSDGRWGDVQWRPATAQAEQSYRLVAGDGKLDLTALPLLAGQRVRVRAEVSLGELKVTVPGDVTTEVHARSSIGDVNVDGHVTSGPRAKVDVVLPPEGKVGKAGAPVIELLLRGRLADVEVRRAVAS